jgi:hypothetical protein
MDKVELFKNNELTMIYNRMMFSVRVVRDVPALFDENPLLSNG